MNHVTLRYVLPLLLILAGSAFDGVARTQSRYEVASIAERIARRGGLVGAGWRFDSFSPTAEEVAEFSKNASTVLAVTVKGSSASPVGLSKTFLSALACASQLEYLRIEHFDGDAADVIRSVVGCLQLRELHLTYPVRPGSTTSTGIHPRDVSWAGTVRCISLVGFGGWIQGTPWIDLLNATACVEYLDLTSTELANSNPGSAVVGTKWNPPDTLVSLALADSYNMCIGVIAADRTPRLKHLDISIGKPLTKEYWERLAVLPQLEELSLVLHSDPVLDTINLAHASSTLRAFDLGCSDVVKLNTKVLFPAGRRWTHLGLSSDCAIESEGRPVECDECVLSARVWGRDTKASDVIAGVARSLTWKRLVLEVLGRDVVELCALDVINMVVVYNAISISLVKAWVTASPDADVPAKRGERPCLDMLRCIRGRVDDAALLQAVGVFDVVMFDGDDWAIGEGGLKALGLCGALRVVRLGIDERLSIREVLERLKACSRLEDILVRGPAKGPGQSLMLADIGNRLEGTGIRTLKILHFSCDKTTLRAIASSNVRCVALISCELQPGALQCLEACRACGSLNLFGSEIVEAEVRSFVPGGSVAYLSFRAVNVSGESVGAIERRMGRATLVVVHP